MICKSCTTSSELGDILTEKTRFQLTLLCIFFTDTQTRFILLGMSICLTRGTLKVCPSLLRDVDMLLLYLTGTH